MSWRGKAWPAAAAPRLRLGRQRYTSVNAPPSRTEFESVGRVKVDLEKTGRVQKPNKEVRTASSLNTRTGAQSCHGCCLAEQQRQNGVHS